MRNFLLFILSFTIMLPAIASTFVPLTMKSQIKESDGIVIGEVLSTESIEENDKILSRVTLKLKNWINVEPQDYEVELYFPGGTVQNRTVKVSGSPKFVLGEEVMVFTKAIKNKMWVQNLGLGKFKIQKVGSSKVLINQIFPNHPLVGQMTLNKFLKLSEKVKKKNFTNRWLHIDEVEKDNKVVGRQLKNTRAISSIEEVENTKEHVKNTTWLLLFMASLFVIYLFIRKRSS